MRLSHLKTTWEPWACRAWNHRSLGRAYLWVKRSFSAAERPTSTVQPPLTTNRLGFIPIVRRAIVGLLLALLARHHAAGDLVFHLLEPRVGDLDGLGLLAQRLEVAQAPAGLGRALGGERRAPLDLAGLLEVGVGVGVGGEPRLERHDDLPLGLGVDVAARAPRRRPS